MEKGKLKAPATQKFFEAILALAEENGIQLQRAEFKEVDHRRSTKDPEVITGAQAEMQFFVIWQI